MPHSPAFTNADRVRAAAAFTQKFITVVGPPASGALPKRRGFIQVGPDNVQLSAFRRKEGPGYELRLVEVDGMGGSASVELLQPIASAAETDLLGRKLRDITSSGNKLTGEVQPWKVGTFDVSI